MICIWGLPLKIGSTIGIRMPKVPQEVPVEKARNTATRKMIAGRKLVSAPAPCMTDCTNSSEPSMLVMPLRVVAKVRIKMGGTMAAKPLGA